MTKKILRNMIDGGVRWFLHESNSHYMTNLHSSFLCNETCMKMGEALCLEIRRKDSRNEA